MNEIYKLIGVLEDIFCKKERGTIKLTHGKHEVFIPINRFCPKEVWISVSECNIGNCSNTEHDLFETVLTHNGFILICDIKSNKRKISWLAKSK